VIGVSIS